MELIKPIERKITIDNRKKIIKSFWVNEKEGSLINDKFFLSHSELVKIIRVYTRESIYIQTNKELDHEFIEALNSLWEKGKNIYLITSKIYPSYRNTIVGKVLIRCSNDIVGDLILIDSSTKISKGLISDSQEFGKEKKYFNLDSKQIEESFEMFIYKFWKRTDFECIDEETFKSPIETQEAPFDIFPRLNTKSIVYDEYLNEHIIERLGQYIGSAKKNITLISNNIDIEDVLISQIADKGENVKVDIITNMKKGLQEVASLFYPTEDYNIYYFNGYIYPMIILDSSIAIVFTNEIKADKQLNSFCITINDSDMLYKIIEYKKSLVFNEKTYIYKNETILNEINENNIVTDIDKIKLSTCRVSEVAEVKGEAEICDSLLELYNRESKREFIHDDEYTKVINYSYYLMPKYRSEKFKKDKIYDEWKNSYLNICKYSEELLNEIKIIVKDNSSIIDNIRFIFSNNKVDSKETIRNINYVIEKLSNNNYSIEELNEVDDILKDAYNNYVKLNYNVLEMKEYREQLEKWEKSKSDIQYSIAEIDDKIKNKEDEINDIQEKLKNNIVSKLEEDIINKKIEIDETLKDSTTESEILRFYFEKNDILESFNKRIEAKKLKKKKDIDKFIENFKELVDDIFGKNDYFDNNYKDKVSNNKNTAMLITLVKGIIQGELRSFISKDLTEFDNMGIEILNKLKEELGILTKELEEEKKKQNCNELKKKNDKLNKDIANLQDEKNKSIIKLQQIGERFEYKASKKNSNILKVKKFEVKIIEEELPKVGVLYRDKNIRHLAIKYWEELKLGITESERLKSELVCEI